MSDARAFDILPAIDLRGGRVVRLRQGDFTRETTYSDDPADVAARFAEAGAKWLHVVDLDGARAGAPRHGEAIQAIIRAVGDRVSVEVAGGLRDATAVATALDLGARRAVVGTIALQDPDLVATLVRRHGPARLAVAIDVRDGFAVGHGWSESEGVDALDAVTRLSDAGVNTFEVTAIDRDGGMAGPDLRLYEQVVELNRGVIIASGGIASLGDLVSLRAVGCSGAIVGRALYEGQLDLTESLR